MSAQPVTYRELFDFLAREEEHHEIMAAHVSLGPSMQHRREAVICAKLADIVAKVRGAT